MARLTFTQISRCVYIRHYTHAYTHICRSAPENENDDTRDTDVIHSWLMLLCLSCNDKDKVAETHYHDRSEHQCSTTDAREQRNAESCAEQHADTRGQYCSIAPRLAAAL